MALPANQDAALPGLPALREACQIFGANAADACLIHHCSNAVYLLPHNDLVVRLATAPTLETTRAMKASGLDADQRDRTGPARPPV